MILTYGDRRTELMKRSMQSLFRAITLAACLAGTAQAQLGGLIRKAADKVVEKKADQMATELKPAKPLEGDPVGAATLDGVLKGLAYELQQQAEALKLHDRQQAKADEWRKATDAGRAESDSYRTKNSTIVACIDESIGASNKKHMSELGAVFANGASSPAAQEMLKGIMDVQQRMAEASQKNDTAAIRRLTTQLMRVQGVEPGKDSAVAFQACGKPPAAPASFVLTARLADELQVLNEALRKVEIDLLDHAAASAGMQPKQYFLARERLWAWNAARRDKTGSGGVTKDEDALFKSHADDIQKIDKALR